MSTNRRKSSNARRKTARKPVRRRRKSRAGSILNAIVIEGLAVAGLIALFFMVRDDPRNAQVEQPAAVVPAPIVMADAQQPLDLNSGYQTASPTGFAETHARYGYRGR